MISLAHHFAINDPFSFCMFQSWPVVPIEQWEIVGNTVWGIIISQLADPVYREVSEIPYHVWVALRHPLS